MLPDIVCLLDYLTSQKTLPHKEQAALDRLRATAEMHARASTVETGEIHDGQATESTAGKSPTAYSGKADAYGFSHSGKAGGA